MNIKPHCTLLLILLLLLGCQAKPLHVDTDPLPSWNEGPAKQSILAFVAAVTD